VNLIRRLLPLVFGLLPLLATASCSDYTVAENEMFVRYLPAEDALLVLEVEHGIHGSAEPGSPAVAALARALAGGRRYPAEGGLIDIDLDKPLPEPEPGQEPERDGLREFAASTSVEQVCLFVDGKERLSFLRLSRLAHFRRMLTLLNGFINRHSSTDGIWSRPLEPDFPIYDQATLEELHAAVDGEHAWFRTEGEAMVIDIPMTEANAARCLEWSMKEARRGPRESIVDWLDELTSLEVCSDRVLLRFGEAPHRVSHLALGTEDQAEEIDYAPLTEALKKAGITFRNAGELDRVRALLEPPPAPLVPK
jgi:hypothetical protein